MTEAIPTTSAPASGTSNSCPDHACDGCYLCRKRRCCRQDRPNFPSFGDWTGPIYGTPGVLATDEDDRVICHVCGAAFHALDHHVRQTHQLWPEEYRVLFGLARERALESPVLRARRRELADVQLRPFRKQIRDIATRMTPEERSRHGRGKTRRLETLQDPVNQARWQEARARTNMARRVLLQSGQLQLPPGFGDAAIARAHLRKALVRRQELLQDPGYRAQLSERIQAARNAREEVTCSVCGQAFTSPRSWLRRGYGTICSDACRERWRLQRGRGRNGLAWEQIGEQLRGLEPGVLEALPPPTPEIVRLFYGLVDGTPWTQAAIGRHLNLPKARIQKILTGPAVTRLLGEPGHRADRQRVTVPCAICGTAVERAPRELRDRVETTCGASCRRELQRRQVSRLTGNAAARSRRLEHLREKTSTPEFREAIRQRALRRYRPYAEVLAALPPEAFAELASSERNLVRQYYGLDRDPPRMLAELAADLRQSQKRVRQRITQAVAQLQAIGGLFDAGRHELP